MAKKFDWSEYRRLCQAYALEVKTADILALLDAHDAAVKAITDALNELPERSAKPMIQRVTDILKTGLRESKL